MGLVLVALQDEEASGYCILILVISLFGWPVYNPSAHPWYKDPNFCLWARRYTV